ncbi:ETEC_3214 domain-containing protein [Pseudoalteromonas atlantica]|uniref:ETEC_3214 domain-containing protein n=1 Tax=Pseudoalteromonas atlantica TaxID=288 RepID=UPI003735E537
MATEKPNSFWINVKNVAVTFAATFLALGAWNDSVDLLQSAYKYSVSKFTNTLDYEKLQLVQVGLNKDFIESAFGPAELMRTSQVDNQIDYTYYLNSKYILTIFYREKQVKAFTIITIKDDFIPVGLLELNNIETDSTTEQLAPGFAGLAVNPKESLFVVEDQLGKNSLFLKKYIGNVGFAARAFKEPLLLNKIEQAMLIDELKVLEQTEPLKSLPLNLYGVGQLSVDMIADAVLSSREYVIYGRKR